jgi:hypothetical protein
MALRIVTRAITQKTPAMVTIRVHSRATRDINRMKIATVMKSKKIKTMLMAKLALKKTGKSY